MERTLVLTDVQTVVDEFVNTDPLREFGTLVEYPMLRPEEVADALPEADVVLCNKTPMNAETLRKAERLRYIGLFATGYNNIDIDYCRSRGITVCNAGSYSTDAVAQQVFAMILAHYNHVAQYDRFVQDGCWQHSKTFSPFVYPLHELAGRTLGVIGLGAIGSAVARIGQAFGMRVLGYRRRPAELPGVRQVPFNELLEHSDIVTVHCPLNADSAGMFNAAAFAKMKPGAVFVNTARGGVMVERDLRDALESGQLGGACIDVLQTEPMAADCVLLGAKNCIITPHIAWAPVETRQRLMGIVADNLRCWLAGHPKNVVSG